MQPHEPERNIGSAWMAFWGITFLASILPTISFARANVADVIEPIRYPWGLLPIELLAFRSLSALAPWIPVFVATLFIASLLHRTYRREYFAASSLIAIIYCSFCTAFYAFGWSMHLKERTELSEHEGSESLPRSEGERRYWELPSFASDLTADAWFRNHSASYRSMAEAVDAVGGYEFEANGEISGGLAWFENGRGHIALNPSLTGPSRFSILIFELTNLFQESKHQEVADRVRRGELNNPAAFALFRESIEFDGIRLHHGVLQELQATLRNIPPEMITWISSTARTFAEYQPPLAYEYFKAQAASGHTAHYLNLFEKHRAEFLATEEK
jgi:hypothetical protein